MKLNTIVLLMTATFVKPSLGFSCEVARNDIPEYDYYGCKWVGAAPACGSTDARLGDCDKDGRQLLSTTKELSISELCKYKVLQGQCCEEYGSGCWIGYKRLWCKSRSCRSKLSGLGKLQSMDEKNEREEF
ncbi:hypothetical protein ETB97_006968 [Aspergillus alliaceus]|uniref:Uncharacterized protein n=1 Tax=Petromyces alliaceus TaxID=209559 RepID=A0A5N7CD62_PETAA|nr:uncharacterized protein BDW43DRAFT_305140 [Aspergillus alliaceus]KAB8239351.1 hypothetical protein BDW43DRAFT_305140 [Aspergillus alliaceus]KAE8392106.1 hypothetical protein BDV23DRAFT_181989 [Aspergillus alliaceus]KAF5864691.1 hypothetical protein ETB97_006968 [Aspergillus burnettii]